MSFCLVNNCYQFIIVFLINSLLYPGRFIKSYLPRLKETLFLQSSFMDNTYWVLYFLAVFCCMLSRVTTCVLEYGAEDSSCCFSCTFSGNKEDRTILSHILPANFLTRWDFLFPSFSVILHVDSQVLSNTLQLAFPFSSFHTKLSVLLTSY